MADELSELWREVNDLQRKVAVTESEVNHLVESEKELTKKVSELTKAITENNLLMGRWRGVIFGVAITVSIIWGAVFGLLNAIGVIGAPTQE